MNKPAVTIQPPKRCFQAKALFFCFRLCYTLIIRKEECSLGNFLFTHPIALVALIAGYVLLVVEFCIPGFGIPGITGIILAVLGIITMQPTPLQALIVVAVYVALLGIALALCLRSAARGRISKSRLVLSDVATKAENAETNDLCYFIGKTGTAHTPLRPVGIAEFDGVRLNVVSDCDFIDRGNAVRVDRVEGKRIVVSKIPA